MSDTASTAQVPDRRAPPPARVATTAAYGVTAAVGLATVHWLIKCYTGGEFHFIPPDDALLEVWIGFTLPTAHLIGRIINHHLQRLAGEEPNA